MRLAGAVAAAALMAITGCTGGTTSAVATHVAGASTTSSADQRATAIYVSALRAHLALDPEVASPTWIGTKFRQSTVEVPVAVQEGITAGLAPTYDVHWVAKPPDVVRSGGSFLVLPQLPSSGDRLHVRLGSYCGNTCGTFAGWVVSRHGDHWTATSDGHGVGVA